MQFNYREAQGGYLVELSYEKQKYTMEVINKNNGELNQGQKNVYKYILENAGVNVTLIAQNLQIPFDTINKQIQALVKKNLIERRGSKRTVGYWAVTN